MVECARAGFSGDADGCSVETAESQLVARAVTGDPAALQRLVSRQHDRLVARVRMHLPRDLRSVLAPEDICQDAYLAAIQQVGRLRGRTVAAFGCWLRSIVDRKLLDAIRTWRAGKRGGRAARPPQATSCPLTRRMEQFAVDAVTPGRVLARRELAEGVEAAVEALQRDYHRAVRLHYLEGLSVADTARRMGRTHGAVRMLCSRGLRRLADEIGDPDRLTIGR